MLGNYLPVLIFLIIASGLAAVMLGMGSLLGRLSVRAKGDAQKLSPYECGFEAYEDARMRFDVRYYLVAILFIVFDLEIAFLFPWAVALGKIGAVGLLAMAIFLGILVVGFIYEWCKGALEWD
ncbi:MAG TPA: NADH-quinone oxidoreductase subunit A [Steroidobacteraceae bacterium]|nr:NADH-quinone oxidoreductase subunit A [Steroidobacteraceae bacterium]